MVATATTVPVVVFLVTVWALHAPMGAAPAHHAGRLAVSSLACLAVIPLVAAGLPLGWALLLLVVPPAGLIVDHHVAVQRSGQDSAAAT